MTEPFHTDEADRLDDEWLTYGRTMEAHAIRLHHACSEVKRTFRDGFRQLGEAWKRGVARARARREEDVEQEGGQQ